MLEQLTDWVEAWADSAAGPAALAVISACEAIFFPIPPDPLLIALALRHPGQALLLAALTTVASVAGGLVGRWLGQRFGRPLLLRFANEERAERVQGLFQRHGFWALLLAGLTPLPYKLFTIAAGTFEVPRLQFVLGSLVGRGLRFGAIGLAIYIWGDRFEAFLEERFDLVMAALGVLLVVGVGAWWAWSRRNGHGGVSAPAPAAAGPAAAGPAATEPLDHA